MRKLLSANFSRLWRSKIFWLISSLMLCWGGFACVLMYVNTEKLGIYDITCNAYFFQGNLCLGLALAVFSALFIGTEYTDGGFRNQISVGHKRFPIYLANLILCSAAGVLFLAAFWLGAMTVGLPLIGGELLTQLDNPFWGIFYSCMSAVSYSGLFCLIAMLDNTKVRAVVIGMLSAVFLLAGGFANHKGLAQPEFLSRTETNEAGQLAPEDNIPNPKYLTKAERMVYEFLNDILPSCQALRPVVSNADYSVTIPVCTLGWTLSLTLWGAAVFQKKDIA